MVDVCDNMGSLDRDGRGIRVRLKESVCLEGEQDKTGQDSVRVPDTGDLVRGQASASPAIGRADCAARAGWRFGCCAPCSHASRCCRAPHVHLATH